MSPPKPWTSAWCLLATALSGLLRCDWVRAQGVHGVAGAAVAGPCGSQDSWPQVSETTEVGVVEAEDPDPPVGVLSACAGGF